MSVGDVVGMTSCEIHIYRPNYYRINGKCANHSKLPQNNRKHNKFQVLYGKCNKFTFEINGNYTYHPKIYNTNVTHAYQVNAMCGK